MPLYEYECTTCHRRIEKIQRFSDPELTVCPHCAGRLERTITAAAVSFKGGGWFKDGYGSVKPTTGGDTTAAASSDSGSTSASAQDSSKAASTPSTPSSAPAAAPAATTTSSSRD